MQPERVPALGLVPMASVIELVSVVTVLPPASSMVTVGWVLSADPPVPLPGWVVKTSWAAGPTVTSKALLVLLSESVVSVAVKV